MSNVFGRLARELHGLRNRFDAASGVRRRDLLARAARLPLPAGRARVAWHDTLLFLAAHPASTGERRLAEAALLRIARAGREGAGAPEGSGLPFAPTVCRFTHDFLRWLLGQRDCRVAFDSFAHGTLTLNEVLALTLPSIERAETTAGLDNDELLDRLRVAPARRLDFLLAELARLDALPPIKDHLFDALGVYVRVTPRARSFSRSYNRLPVGRTFCHGDVVARVDARDWLARPLPEAVRIPGAADVIRRAMALMSRETDPATYLDESSLRLWPLERGITVALFGMRPERQLPLESYIGFTLFKNGFPAAYGGAWVFGRRMKFGINIFEPYRGGESALVMCQILRTYVQAFGARHLEVEPYQYGQDNPDGIKSGAFWFYFKHGFRPTERELLALALAEHRRIRSQPGYRSSEATLLRFTEGGLALDLGGHRLHAGLAEITAAVTRFVARRHRGDRAAAEAAAVQALRRDAGIGDTQAPFERQALTETALMREALRIDDPQRLALLAEAVRTKGRDGVSYQRLLLQLFDGPGG